MLHNVMLPQLADRLDCSMTAALLSMAVKERMPLAVNVICEIAESAKLLDSGVLERLVQDSLRSDSDSFGSFVMLAWTCSYSYALLPCQR